GDQLAEASTLAALGQLLRAMGNSLEARRHYHRAATLYAHAGHLRGEADLTFEMARLEMAEDPVKARHHFERAASLYEAAGITDQRDRALKEARGLAAS
ncbi:MAG: soluble NSF attachment family protein, partial [Rhodospirillales bacterium]|nr:soluble NSF attachment family protein [Rhodospirillales bacterium]